MNHLYPWIRVDALSGFIASAAAVFAVLTALYSYGFMKGRRHLLQYYLLSVLAAAASIGAVISNNLIVFLMLWGFVGLTLYLLINHGGDKANATAKKTFIIVGGSDALMILGIGIIYHLTGTLLMDKINIPLGPRPLSLAAVSYACLAIGAFAKAGAMPFHSWIPDTAEDAPVPVVAFLPASLDKLLGIYLLARMSLDIFVVNTFTSLVLMMIGAFTILAAVMMALVQHDMKRLLGYHAVSQVGYMVLGIGTGVPIGIAGGLFHMLNHAIYKSCLFLTAGNVEYRAGKTDLDELGGLSKVMPLTYISCLVASLAISGVPPFNGFVSKWMIYQGLIGKFGLGVPEPGGKGLIVGGVVAFCLAAAMFGSGLTLASFMKLLHAVFLGQKKYDGENAPDMKEAPFQMWAPCVILAGLCVIFGIFAYQIPLRFFILPSVPGVNFIGIWHAGLSTILVLSGLALGFVIFLVFSFKSNSRRDIAFIGSETGELGQTKISGTEFYNTVREFGMLNAIYNKAEEHFFDIYDQGKNLFSGIGRLLRYLHNGVLPTYLVWALLGMIFLFLTVMGK